MVSTKVLKEFGLFKGLDDSELTKIPKLCHKRILDKGTLYFTQGKKATEVHLCRSGKVNIVVRLSGPWGTEVVVYNAGAGQVFGWSSILEPSIYTASAVCVERTEDIYIKAPDLLNLFEEEPHIGYVLMRNLSSIINTRLAEYRSKLSIEIATSIQKEW